MAKQKTPLDPDPNGDAFPPGRLIEIKVELDSKDWDQLRDEGRSLICEFASRPQKDFEDYTWFDGKVEVDGRKFKHVAIRKKGYIGSLSNTRPSLKLHFGRLVKGRTFRGRQRMTLNNNRQDPSNVRQIVAYDRFRSAEAPAPHCCLARVTVNGVDLGIYTHVESMKEPFLERTFGDANGSLYEGQFADFSVYRLKGFEKKSLAGEKGKDKKKKKKKKKEKEKEKENRDAGLDDIHAVIRALEETGDDLLPALRKVIDTDEFLTHWAMEVITGHWDGYAGSANNYLLYKSHGDGLLRFLPTGADGTLNATGPTMPPGIPASTLAMGEIAYALYSHRPTRALYHERLRKLLDRLWDPAVLRAQVDYFAALAGSADRDLVEPHDFVATRKEKILAELDDDGPEWSWPPNRAETKPRPVGRIHGSFAAIFGTNEAIDSRDVSISSFEIQGVTQNLTDLRVSAGYAAGSGVFGPIAENPEREALELMSIRFLGANQQGDEVEVLLRVACSGGNYPAKEVRFHGLETVGFVLQSTPPHMQGFISDGEIRFENAGSRPGERVVGSFNALLTDFPR